MGPVVLIAQLALLLAADAGVAAQVTAPKVEILGLWKGTSECAKVAVNEFCRDETVVYNFVDVPSQPATVSLKAARVDHGALTRTYDLYFTFQPEQGSWTCEFEREQRRGVWEYVVSGDGMTGTAKLLPDLTVVRTVTAKRTSQERVLEPAK